MAEGDFEGREGPQNNSNLFIFKVSTEVAGDFRDLDIIASKPQAQRSGGFGNLMKKVGLSGAKGADAESVDVLIKGDRAPRIEEATRRINDLSNNLGGVNTVTSVISDATLRSAAEKQGHRPEYEDLPSLVRYLTYMFK